MWSSGPASHGHSSGNGWREQVMTRQPAAEKRFTVAWPMPRLAPVSSSVRRGWLVCGAVGMIGNLEHFPAKWEPVRRRKCDNAKESRACPASILSGACSRADSVHFDAWVIRYSAVIAREGGRSSNRQTLITGCPAFAGHDKAGCKI